MKRILFAILLGAIATTGASAQRRAATPAPTTVPDSDYMMSPAADRFTVTIQRTRRGNSVPIDHARLTRLCGDEDGCTMRIGMHNWDNTGRVASREVLFFYNPRNGVWRASLGDIAGTDANTTTEHPIHAWACYVTDGAYRNFEPQGDTQLGFELLSWREFNTDCWLTVID